MSIAAIYSAFLAGDKSSSGIPLIVSFAFVRAASKSFLTSVSTTLPKRAFVASRSVSVSVLAAVVALSTSASFCLIVAELILLIAASFSAGVK